jgi:anion-transporting  ArsA/GET3 family ATPase
MPITKGATYTPDKKGLLLKEVKDEIVNVEYAMKNQGILNEYAINLQSIRKNLIDIYKDLVDKKGVVTPEETDRILESIDTSKKTRLNDLKDYKIKLNLTTILVVTALAYLIYNMTKGKI